MSLNKDQFKFTWMIGQLIDFAYKNGYTLTFGDAYAKGGHIQGSKHYDRLAVDFNLFKDGAYLTDTADHYLLGVFWEMIGGTWGGRFKNPDGNHYSLNE
jgi:hypothetical protein